MPSLIPESPDSIDLTQLDAVDLESLHDREFYSEASITGEPTRPLGARGCVFSTVRFTGGALRGSKLPQVRMTDAIIEQADCSNATWIDARLVRCAWNGCKATGIDLRGGSLRDVRFTDCKMPESFFQEASLDRVWFESCNLRSADFSSATLTSVTIRDCDVRELRFMGARIDALDLRGSRIEHIAIDKSAVRHIIIDPIQAPAIMQSLGARVMNVHEDL
jgi:uncharacterized protein YjbI with pentapeptide repeats